MEQLRGHGWPVKGVIPGKSKVRILRLIIEESKCETPSLLVGRVARALGPVGRVGQHAHRQLPGGRAAAADPAAQGRLPVPGPGQVPRLVRRRPTLRPGRVHGRLAGPVRGRRPRLAGYRRRLADQAELVPGHDRGPDDPPAAQRTMSQRAGSTVVEVAASHCVYLSQPAHVADLIKQAVAAAAVPQ